MLETLALCEEAADSTNHFLRGCTFTRSLLNALHVLIPYSHQQQDSKVWLANFLTSSNGKGRVLIVLSYWLSCHCPTPFSIPPTQAAWCPPAKGIIKLNFDASLNISTKSSISGVVARNSLGLIVVACAISHFGSDNAFVAEARACEDAINLAINFGLHSIQEGLHLLLLRYRIEEAPSVVEQIALRDIR
ncbi:hypothetical protein V6N13_051931 [Hibiscus sabdariffa]